MVNTVRDKVSIDNLIVENMKARGPNANNIESYSEERNVTSQRGCGSRRRENCLRQLSLTQSIIDNVRGGERVTAKPWKTSLVKLNSIQNLRIPRKSNVKTVDNGRRILDKHDLGGEATALRRSSTARRTRSENRIIRN
jgi:hypothetical protein